MIAQAFGQMRIALGGDRSAMAQSGAPVGTDGCDIGFEADHQTMQRTFGAFLVPFRVNYLTVQMCEQMILFLNVSQVLVIGIVTHPDWSRLLNGLPQQLDGAALP